MSALPPEPAAEDEKLRIGISACLLGEEVRWDGGHKRDAFICQTLSEFVTFVTICPEVGLGLGIPRKPIRLQRRGDDVRLEEIESGRDHSQAMEDFATGELLRLRGENLSGFILKKDSPSCGFQRVKVWDENGVPSKTGVGRFTERLQAEFPSLPIEDEGRLHDPRLRENFYERVFAYRRLQQLRRSEPQVKDIVAFHTREKMLLLAHDPEAYKALGRMVASPKGRAPQEFLDEYEVAFMQALSVKATVGRHVNVLQHMCGFLKDHLERDDKDELAEVIESYQRHLVPLLVPLTLIKHWIRSLDVEYLQGQTYLEPHPQELMLRNHC